jgi:tetratricopeptide (TPR) repeat protein
MKMNKTAFRGLFLGLAGLSLFVAALSASPAVAPAVRVSREILRIPTYVTNEPERLPIFYFGRAYQGARGPVYPYPLLDELTDRREDKTYTALYLENDFVRYCILPEIGGRIFEAVDKTNGYNIFYRQHVIKPALIGMLGAWISGGVEWNIPHHHRATSFRPVDWAIAEGPDGGQTIWVGETELRHGMRWSVGLTLRPGSSALEVSYRIFNGTPFAQSILCWANAAVHADENYQIFFPPGVRLATFHGKNQFSHWPVSHEVYNGVDYSRGVDVSWWKNHPRPTSFFAYGSDEDFLAGYDHGREAGVVLVGDHTVTPGKKLWTWGTGSEGARWEKILTDADGPYLELMFGSFSDNQPDYSWIQPDELKSVRQSWYPLRGIGGVQKANASAACRLELISALRAVVGIQTTSIRRDAVLRLTRAGLDREGGADGPRPLKSAAERPIFEKKLDVGPDRPFSAEIALPSETSAEMLRLSLVTAEGEELISYRPRRVEEPPLPRPVTPPPAPGSIAANEELYLAGLRLEQFHNPALEPAPYYLEVLRRDPDDARANTALGRLDLLAGRFEEAEARLRRAAGRLSANETRPKDTEPLYYLGVALRFLGREGEAYEVFGRAAWGEAWSASSWLEMAELAARRGDAARALELTGQSLARNGLNAQAADFRAALLRRSGGLSQAEGLARAACVRDPLDFWAANELALVLAARGGAPEAAKISGELRAAMRDSPQNYLELAAGYARGGLYEEAVAILRGFASRQDTGNDPMVYYDAAFYAHKLGRADEARRYLDKAGLAPPEFCFPSRLESIEILRWAETENPRDARAPFYLGNLLFGRQPEAAIAEWEKARSLDGAPAAVERNLGLAYSRVKNDLASAVSSLERAVARDPGDPRLYSELDGLYDLAGEPPRKRLDFLLKHHEVVARRDDSLSREINLLVELGSYDRAIELLARHHFHVWEGSAGVHDMFVDAHLSRGRKSLSNGNPRAAGEDFRAALAYPDNLEVARPDSGGRDPEIYYWLGTACEAVADPDGARRAFERSANGGAEPGELLYFQGLAWQKLGRRDKTSGAFDSLISWARAGLEDKPAMDYFAKFGESEPAARRAARFHYVMGLGFRGKGQAEDARREFEQALALYPFYSRARRELGQSR